MYLEEYCLYFVLYRVKDSRLLSDAFNVDPLYLKHDNQGAMPDFRVWQSETCLLFSKTKYVQFTDLQSPNFLYYL